MILPKNSGRRDISTICLISPCPAPSLGWALTDKSTYQNEQYQNQLDAEAIYYLLEHDILPLYYEHGERFVRLSS